MKNQATWEPIYALPNISVETAIEGGPIAIMPQSDERLDKAFGQRPTLRDFFCAFQDQFGRSITPSILAIDTKEIPVPVNVELLAGFRDLLVASIIPLGWSRVNQEGENPYCILYSDNLAFYPFAPSRNAEFVGSMTPASLSLDETSKFLGQTTPGIPRINLTDISLDRFLYETLLCQWHKHFIRRKRGLSSRRLFRSLNMANEAARIPGGRETGIYDYGRAIALWISAFEILSHPGGKERTDVLSVERLFDRADWTLKKLSIRYYKPLWIPRNQKSKTGKTNLAKTLYHRLHKCRNAFIHGNPVRVSDIKYPGKGLPLYQSAPLLYRMVLAGYLQMKINRPDASQELSDYDRKEYAERIFTQSQIESGLLAVQHGSQRPHP